MIKENKAIIMSHSICLLCLIILTVWFIQPSSADVIIGSAHEERCTIKSIEGPVVQTSCRTFTFGEEMKITDISGRSIPVSEIPLPSDATIVYQCISKENCASIKTIIIQKKIKVIPK